MPRFFPVVVLTLVLNAGATRDLRRAETLSANYESVRKYVRQHYHETYRNASGGLEYPYLVPSGPYEQCWDW